MESKLPIFLSENILKLLGFYKGNVAKKKNIILETASQKGV